MTNSKLDKLIMLYLVGAIFISTIASLASCYCLFKIQESLEGNDIIKLERYKE